MRAALIRINTITANIIIMKKTAMTQPFNDVLPSPLMTSYTWPEALKSLLHLGQNVFTFRTLLHFGSFVTFRPSTGGYK